MADNVKIVDAKNKPARFTATRMKAIWRLPEVPRIFAFRAMKSDMD
jgi:hypothetical protein